MRPGHSGASCNAIAKTIMQKSSGHPQTQRVQYPLIKEYRVNHNMKPLITAHIPVIMGCWALWEYPSPPLHAAYATALSGVSRQGDEGRGLGFRGAFSRSQRRTPRAPPRRQIASYVVAEVRIFWPGHVAGLTCRTLILKAHRVIPSGAICPASSLPWCIFASIALRRGARGNPRRPKLQQGEGRSPPILCQSRNGFRVQGTQKPELVKHRSASRGRVAIRSTILFAMRAEARAPSSSLKFQFSFRAKGFGLQLTVWLWAVGSCSVQSRLQSVAQALRQIPDFGLGV